MRNVSNAVADFFVICSANTDTHTDSIAVSVEQVITQDANEKPIHREGYQKREWILLDYGNVVVHVFQKDRRTYYGLEELWGDAKHTAFDDVL